MTADEWNARHPIGSLVKYYSIRGDDKHIISKTRTPAWTLGSGQVVVSIEGKTGGVSIDHIEVLSGEE